MKTLKLFSSSIIITGTLSILFGLNSALACPQIQVSLGQGTNSIYRVVGDSNGNNDSTFIQPGQQKNIQSVALYGNPNTCGVFVENMQTGQTRSVIKFPDNISALSINISGKPGSDYISVYPYSAVADWQKRLEWKASTVY